jgi:hypothetical protein
MAEPPRGRADPAASTDELGGDPACWLDAVCDRCGALIEPAQPHRCRTPATDQS